MSKRPEKGKSRALTKAAREERQRELAELQRRPPQDDNSPETPVTRVSKRSTKGRFQSKRYGFTDEFETTAKGTRRDTPRLPPTVDIENIRLFPSPPDPAQASGTATSTPNVVSVSVPAEILGEVTLDDNGSNEESGDDTIDNENTIMNAGDEPPEEGDEETATYEVPPMRDGQGRGFIPSTGSDSTEPTEGEWEDAYAKLANSLRKLKGHVEKQEKDQVLAARNDARKRYDEAKLKADAYDDFLKANAQGRDARTRRTRLARRINEAIDVMTNMAPAIRRLLNGGKTREEMSQLQSLMSRMSHQTKMAELTAQGKTNIGGQFISASMFLNDPDPTGSGAAHWMPPPVNLPPPDPGSLCPPTSSTGSTPTSSSPASTTPGRAATCTSSTTGATTTTTNSLGPTVPTASANPTIGVDSALVEVRHFDELLRTMFAATPTSCADNETLENTRTALRELKQIWSTFRTKAEDYTGPALARVRSLLSENTTLYEEASDHLNQALCLKIANESYRTALKAQRQQVYVPPGLRQKAATPSPVITADTRPIDVVEVQACLDGPDWTLINSNDPTVLRRFFDPDIKNPKVKFETSLDPRQFSGSADLAYYRSWKNAVHAQVMMRPEIDWAAKCRKIKSLLTGDAWEDVEYMEDSLTGLRLIILTLESDYGKYEDHLTALNSKLSGLETLDVNRPRSIQKAKHLARRIKAWVGAGGQDAASQMMDSAIFSHLYQKMTDKTMERWNDYVDIKQLKKPTTRDFDEWADLQQKRVRDKAHYLAISKNADEKAVGGAKKTTKAARAPVLHVDHHDADVEDDLNDSEDDLEAEEVLFLDKRGCCFLCGEQDHYVPKCPKFNGVPVAERRKMVYDNQLCFCCLGKGHTKARCPRKRPCDRCRSYNHHSFLHLEREELKGNNTATATPKAGATNNPPPKGPPEAKKAPEVVQKQIDEITERFKKEIAVAYDKHQMCAVLEQEDAFAAPLCEEEVLLVEPDLVEKVYLQRRNHNGFPVVPIIVENPVTGEQVEVNAGIDSFCSTTIMTNWLADYLNLDTKDGWVVYDTVSGQAIPEKVRESQVNLIATDGTFHLDNVDLKTAKKIPKNIRPPEIEVLKRVFPTVRKYHFPRPRSASSIQLLIGIDQMAAHRSLWDAPSEPWEPIVRMTPFGLSCIYHRSMLKKDNFDQPRKNNEVVNLVQHMDEIMLQGEHDLNVRLETIWDMDSIGLQTQAQLKQWSLAEVRAWQHVRDTLVQHEDGSYECGVPWKTGRPNLPENYDQVRRLQPRIEKAFRDKGESLRIDGTFEDWIARGFAHEITDETEKQQGFYIPWFGVYKETSETTAFRIVLNGAKFYGGTTLNEEMFQGPKLHSDLVDVLTNFRKYEHALICDISKMYMMIHLKKEDRKYHRFIYQGRAYELSSWPFGNKAAPFVALYVVRQHVMRHGDEDLKKVIMHSSYVDDIMLSFPTAQQAIDTWKKMNACLQLGGFKLIKFNTNSQEVLDSIPLDLRSKKVEVGQGIEDPSTLGLLWTAMESDQFRFEAPKDDGKRTKAGLASFLGKLFDPLGLLDPVTTRGRMLMQELHCEADVLGLGWYTDLTQYQEDNLQLILRRWTEYAEEIKQIREYRLERLLIPRPHEKQVVAILNDGSRRAMNSVAYMVNGDFDPVVNIIMSKRRLTPTKRPTIPKIELNAATMGTRLSVKLRPLFPEATFDFATDSMCTLHWILKPTRPLNMYESTRVAEITEHTRQFKWRHVPTDLNTADLPTRGMRVSKFLTKKVWPQGPEYLKEPISAWPDRAIELNPEDELVIDEAVQKERHELVCSTDTAETAVDLSFGIVQRPMVTSTGLPLTGYVSPTVQNWHPQQAQAAQLVIDRASCLEKLYVWDNVSSWGRKIRLLSMWGRYRKANRDKSQPQLLWESWVKLVSMYQVRQWKEELKSYVTRGHWPKESDVYKHLPTIDQAGLIRVGARASLQDPGEAAMRPVLVPKLHQSPFVGIVEQAHRVLGHNAGNKARVSSMLRRGIWNRGMRNQIKTILKRCVECQKIRKSVCKPLMEPIPAGFLDNWQEKEPFSEVDVDVAGPFRTKRPRSRAHDLNYVLTVICRHTRAVHLEVMTEISTDRLIMAMSRVTSIRGRMAKVHSDNGTNFVGAKKAIVAHRGVELNRDWNNLDWTRIRQAETLTGIAEWSFSAPYAPWSNGLAEAAVKLAKTQLWQTFKHAHLDSEQFRTAVYEAMNVINSRPLEALDAEDAEDLEFGRFLTPNHLLIGRVGGEVLQDIPTCHNLVKRYDEVQKLVLQFRRKWLEKLLTKVHSQPKWLELRLSVQPGQLVLLAETQGKRHEWQLARVERVVRDINGCAQHVDVRRRVDADPKSKDIYNSTTVTLRRHVRNLVPLTIFNQPTE